MMTMLCVQQPSRELTLRIAWLFSECSNEELEEIGALCTPVEVCAGQTLVREGASDPSCAVVVSGQATVERAGHPIGHAADGAILGLAGLIDGGASSVTVVAETDMHVLVLQYKDLADLLSSGTGWSIRHRLQILAAEQSAKLG
jgi:CRP-like cAMP-binding protein